ncbi:hypothetical protein [Novosphingobium humi]|uniref:Uncharacterized protein n=1 Tax=Novosphingobium humi TaxID=2282397 RepID=A0ABY7TXT4_9SPHN|nr:hypothetical protein [Novosphingobium humi]WCT78092.1 hypothetical protein PQ457_03715 [Novosphingobium humi]WJS98400.1 hypothetical protein NYQ05_14955 [Novosphingobium humi]
MRLMQDFAHRALPTSPRLLQDDFEVNNSIHKVDNGPATKRTALSTNRVAPENAPLCRSETQRKQALFIAANRV